MQISQDQNREKGESRTNTFLVDYFWVLKRSVDVGGADFLIQQPCTSLSEIHDQKKSIQPFGVVQAKFFQSRTTVTIKKDYVVFDGEVVNEFFVMIHSGEGDNKTLYFFTAQEIVDEFYIDSSDTNYCFGITNDRRYKDYKDLPSTEILDKINTNLQLANNLLNSKFIERIYKVFKIPTKHNQAEPKFIYKLRRVEGHAIVLAHNVKQGGSAKYLLEYRRDLFNNFGSFEWGYIGDGSYFLSLCILAHHLNGALPEEQSILNLQRYLDTLDRDKSHDIRTEQVVLSIG